MIKNISRTQRIIRETVKFVCFDGCEQTLIEVQSGDKFCNLFSIEKKKESLTWLSRKALI